MTKSSKKSRFIASSSRPWPSSEYRRNLSGRRRLPLFVIGLVTAWSMAGCARRARTVEPPVPVPLDRVAELLEDSARLARAVARYQALVRARGRGPEGRFSAKLAVVFERPDRMRIELLGAFGATRWVAVAGTEGITVVFPGRREFVREPRVEDVVGRLLGVPLSAEEIMAALSGSGFPSSDAEPVAAWRRGDLVSVELAGGKSVEFVKEQIRQVNSGDHWVRYPNNWRSEGRQVPYRVELGSGEIEARLDLESIDINIRLHAEAFTLSVPEDGRRLLLEDVEGEALFVQQP